MGRNDAKTQRWLPNAFALRSSDWRLCGMPGRGRPPGTGIAVRCDACRRRKLSAAHCQRQGHLAAAAGAANAAAAQPVPPGARCAHTSHGAAPGPQQPANNPTLLPLPVSPGHVARTPRSAGQQPSAADAGVGGQNLFSSQAGSGTRPAGEASSSGTAPQGRSEADIGKDAARRQQKREGGRSSAERMMFASRGGCGSPSNCGASHGGRAAHLVEETAERLDYGCVSRAEFSSDSEAAGPCELGHGCKPRGVVHACSFPVFAFFGAE